MYIKIYNTLPEEAAKIRKDVFVTEQGFHDEFDEVDTRSHHVVMFDGEKPIATCRYFPTETAGTYVLGRIAVIRSCRGQNIGSLLLQLAEAELVKAGGTKALIHAQERASIFYEKQGYRRFGTPDSEEGCPHIWMSKELS